MNIIPSIDLVDGSPTRLPQGKFQNMSIIHSTVDELAKTFIQYGADHLQLVDLSGSKNKHFSSLHVVETLAKFPLKLHVGGGISSVDIAQKILEKGAFRVILGSIATTDTGLTKELIKELGADRVILYFDIQMENGQPKVLLNTGQSISQTVLWTILDKYANENVLHVACSDMQRNGMLLGPPTKLLQTVISRYPQFQLQACGGIRHKKDLLNLYHLGASACLVQRALANPAFKLGQFQG